MSLIHSFEAVSGALVELLSSAMPYVFEEGLASGTLDATGSVDACRGLGRRFLGAQDFFFPGWMLERWMLSWCNGSEVVFD